MKALISVIIPTYNREHLIAATLDSILAQSYPNWECIIVDDGSTDGTEALLQSYIEKDPRFLFYKRPEDRPKGANACRNYGFDLCRGDFVNWFDSDDVMLPDKLKLQINALKENEKAPYCICQSSWFDKEENRTLGLRSKEITSKNRFEDYILNKIYWLTTAPMWRKSFIIENNLKFNENLSQSQEYDFHIHALAISENYAIVNKPLVIIIKHKEAISYKIYQDDSKMKSNLDVKAMIFEQYTDKLSDKTKIKLFEILTLIYKDLLKFKNFNVAFFAMKLLYKNIGDIKASFFKKLIFLFKLGIAFISYFIFGRGYNIVKPLT